MSLIGSDTTSKGTLIGGDTTLKATLGWKGARGYSAYEIAVQNGFVGSESDWLANLGTSSHFDRHSDIYTTTTVGEDTFDIPDSYTSNSFIDVYVEGERLNSDEYLVNTTTNKIVLTSSLDVVGTKVEVVTLTMSTNNLPIVETINSESNNTNVASAKCVYENLNIYYDDITCEKMRDTTSNTDYYITTIPNTYRFKLGTGKDNLSSVESTLNFSHRKKATLCINAGLFNTNTNKPYGTLIQDGVALQNYSYNNPAYKELGIKEDGNFVYFAAQTVTATEMLNAGVKTGLLGFYPIITNGTAISFTDTSVNPRQTLGRKNDGTYIVLTCDGRTQYDSGMTNADVQRILLTHGVTEAYLLDGGGSTSTVLKGIKQNKNIDNMTEDREVATFLYITKENVTTNSINEAFSEISKLKQELNEKIIELQNIESGYLKLKGKSGAYLPGIEFYTNNSDSRIGKFGITDLSTVPKGAYATVRNTEGNDETVFRATKDGLYNIYGQLANIMGYARRVPNSNCNIKGEVASIYYMFEADKNSPGNGIGACFLIHLPFDSDLSINMRQILIPLNQSRPIMMRACNSTGEWGNWYNSSVSKGNSNDRPTARATQGDMYYDTSLRKPIWFTGTVWIDAAGTEV